MATSDKLTYLNTTKGLIKGAINNAGANITNDTFRSYATTLGTTITKMRTDRDTLVGNGVVGTSTGSISGALNYPIYEDRMSKLSTQETTILPSGYTQVDYITANGSQYIDTGVKLNPGLFYDITFKYASSLGGGNSGICGRYTADNTIIAQYQFGNKIAIVYGTSENKISHELTTDLRDKHNIKVIDYKLYIDNEYITENTNAVLGETEEPFYLFRQSSLYGEGNIYSCKLYNNNTLIRDFIPCYRNSDNEVGLYDLVNDVFYTNDGEGSFTFGNIAILPNPNYPIEVKTVKGYRNLFDKTTITAGKNISTSTGNLYNDSNAFATDYIYIHNLSSISWNGKSATINTYGCFYDENKEKISSIEQSSKTKEVPTNAYYVRFGFLNEYLDNLIVNEGNTSLPYVPYGTNWIYTTISDGTNSRITTIPLNDNEIVGIGDYKDEYIIDKNGHCWLNKKTNKIVLDGSESGWSIASSSGTRVAYERLVSDIVSYTNGQIIPDLLSNRFTPISYNGTWKIGNVSRWINRKSLVLIVEPNISTTEDFKTWLSTHNTEVYYVLATANLIDLNYNVDLTLYEGINNITNSEDMDMAIKYVEDIETILGGI